MSTTFDVHSVTSKHASPCILPSSCSFMSAIHAMGSVCTLPLGCLTFIRSASASPSLPELLVPSSPTCACFPPHIEAMTMNANTLLYQPSASPPQGDMSASIDALPPRRGQDLFGVGGIPIGRPGPAGHQHSRTKSKTDFLDLADSVRHESDSRHARAFSLSCFSSPEWHLLCNV